MRVLHVEAGRHLYGGARQVEYLIAGLAAARGENVVACAAGGELASRAGDDATVVALPMRGELDVALAGRLAGAIRDHRPDLVHVHSRRGADLYAGVAARIAGVPAILTRRVDAAEPAAWARLKYRPYARVVAISRAIEAQLLRGGVAAARVVRIASAVDTDRYRPSTSARERLAAAFGLARDSLVVGVVSQLIARKRHELLFDVLPAVVRGHPHVRVLCFGGGPREASLRARVARLGLDAHVVFAGFRDDLADLLPGLDLLVHPAEREGLGLALLEAGSCGVPVLAAAAGGVVDVVEHGRTGWLFPANDRDALAAGLETLAADAAERARLGAAARAAALARFGVAAMTAAYLSLYAAVVREHEAPRMTRGAFPAPPRGPAP